MRLGGEARPAGFGQFGRAAVAEVLTPAFLRERVEAGLVEAAGRTDWREEFGVDLASVRVGRPEMVFGRDDERCFRVRVRIGVETGVGPRLLAIYVSAVMRLDLTMRVRAYAPATVRVDVDPVTEQDVRLRTSARGALGPLVGSGALASLTGATADAVPMFVAAVNRELVATVEERSLDVLDRLRAARLGSGGSGGAPGPSRALTLAGRFRARLEQRAARPDRETGPGPPERDVRIGFAEFGESLVRRGIDRDMVAGWVAGAFGGVHRVELDAPQRIRGAAVVRVEGATPEQSGAEQLCYRLGLRFDLDVTVDGTAIAATVRAQVRLRITTRVDPATVVIALDPVSGSDVWLVRARRLLCGVLVPVPRRVLAGQVRGLFAQELNARLAEAGQNIVAADLITELLDNPVPTAS